MRRKRRDLTTAGDLNVGDLIEPDNNGIRATVTDHRMNPDQRVAEPHVLVAWAYPDDFSVNANFRGRTSGRYFRPGDPITRWLDSGRANSRANTAASANTAELPDPRVDLDALAATVASSARRHGPAEQQRGKGQEVREQEPNTTGSTGSTGTVDVSATQIGQEIVKAADVLGQIQGRFDSMMDQLAAMRWSGAPLDHLQQSRSHLARASQAAAAAANNILRGTVRVGDAYAANAQVGVKESVVDK